MKKYWWVILILIIIAALIAGWLILNHYCIEKYEMGFFDYVFDNVRPTPLQFE